MIKNTCDDILESASFIPATPHQNTVIREYLEKDLDALLHDHYQSRYEWYPSDLLPCAQSLSAEQKKALEEMKERSQNLPDAIRISLILNLITEEGLPSYHRLLHQAFGGESSWRVWQNTWTAEEDKHGTVLRDYLRETRLCEMTKVERMQFQYVTTGWSPEWAGDPYTSIVYTVFQERATQISHRNLGLAAKSIEPTLSKVLACLAGDESRHFKFYGNLLKKLVEVDIDGVLQTIYRVLKTFKMPGENIPGFVEMSCVEHAIDVFGPKNFSEVIRDVIVYIGLDKRKNLSAYSEVLKEKIMEYPARLLRLHHKMIDRVKEKIAEFQFEVISNRKIVFL
jgi:acyl-[acyl-carrier-protein] desaturase